MTSVQLTNDEIIALLHNRSRGAQDRYYDKLNYENLPYYDELIETKSIELNSSYIFPNSDTDASLANKGIANIRVEGDYEYVSLDIGGQSIDRLYKVFHDNQMVNFKREKCCIPFLRDHNIEIICKNGTATITYDLVSISNGDKKYDYVYYSHSYCGPEVISTRTRSISLCFNNMVKKLIVTCENPIASISLIPYPDDETDETDETDAPDAPVLDLDFTKINENLWELDFGNTHVNFSRIDNAKLYVSSLTPTTIYPTALSICMGISMVGKYGMLFTK